MEVGRDVVFECKVNNLGNYKVVNTHNDHRDDGWLVVMLIRRMMMLLTIITACTTGRLA